LEIFHKGGRGKTGRREEGGTERQERRGGGGDKTNTETLLFIVRMVSKTFLHRRQVDNLFLEKASTHECKDEVSFG
jgi:hypothetical protein